MKHCLWLLLLCSMAACDYGGQANKTIIINGQTMATSYQVKIAESLVTAKRDIAAEIQQRLDEIELKFSKRNR